jgi:hypothetical protein
MFARMQTGILTIFASAVRLCETRCRRSASHQWVALGPAWAGSGIRSKHLLGDMFFRYAYEARAPKDYFAEIPELTPAPDLRSGHDTLARPTAWLAIIAVDTVILVKGFLDRLSSF